MLTCKNVCSIIAIPGLLVFTTAFSFAATIERVTENEEGIGGNGISHESIISDDGKYIVFESVSSNLVPNDTNGRPDIFVRNLDNGEITRVSVDSSGAEAQYPPIGLNALGSPFDLSTDGRFVVFESTAYNLVEGDENDYQDIFLHDINSGSTTRISISTGGEEANEHSFSPSISADGRFVAFYSHASNLVEGDMVDPDDPYLHAAVYLHDVTSGTTEKLSPGGEGPRISADGRFVAFSTVRPLVSDDTDALTDVFVLDRDTQSIELVSVDSEGNDIEGASRISSMSASGRYVVFTTVGRISFFVEDIYLHDRLTGTTTFVSGGTLANSDPYISADGRFLSFASDSDEIVPFDTNGLADVFVYDHATGGFERVSVDEDGNEANGNSFFSSLSADGRYVAFGSQANNLIPDDENFVADIFVADRGPITAGITPGTVLSKIELLVPEYLKKGQANALGAKLNAAAAALQYESDRAGCQQLRAFLNQVSGLIKAGQLDADKGQELIDDVTVIMNEVGCFG